MKTSIVLILLSLSVVSAGWWIVCEAACFAAQAACVAALVATLLPSLITSGSQACDAIYGKLDSFVIHELLSANYKFFRRLCSRLLIA